MSTQNPKLPLGKPLAFAIVAAALALATAPASAALIAHYELDSDVTDATGNGNDGTLSGTTSFSTDVPAAISGSTHSLQFNDGGAANDGFVDLPEGDATEPDNDLFIDGSYTIAAWVKFDARSGTGGGAAKIVGNFKLSGDFQHNYLLRVFHSDHGSIPDKVGFIARDASGDTQTLLDPTVPNLGEWIHYAATFDASDGAMKLYRDGSQVDSQTLSNFDGFDATDQIASLGDADSDNHNESQNFNGKLDDVRIYNEALDADGIGALIPEPATLALLGLGGAVMLGRRRR